MQVHAIQAVSEPKATLPSRNYFATNGQVISLQEHEAWLSYSGIGREKFAVKSEISDQRSANRASTL
jgi:hypothetical protein